MGQDLVSLFLMYPGHMIRQGVSGTEIFLTLVAGMGNSFHVVVFNVVDHVSLSVAS